jgi:hypothetical protein
MARSGNGPQPTVFLAVSGQNHLGAKTLRPVGMIAVAMGEQDETDPAPLRCRAAYGVEVTLDLGPRIDHRAWT